MSQRALLLLVLAQFPANVHAQGYKPDEAAGKMQVGDGLAVKLFAAEPNVRQPILVKCDDRGRLWTIQYLQYPNPAGLKRVKIDRWSRTVYDRIPEPPPKGPKGADRITICEDADGDGKADRFKDFAGGLNLCTGLAFGHGGVFVLQVPYLLWYPDRNRDDIPDGDPEMLLSGFGMEDAQSLANHLTWGPDGWLYGVTGSTSSNLVRGIEFQQGVWRYHPLSKKFELFCEGGGNLFGLTFDADGNLFYSSNGSTLAVHGVQGGYYRKVFDKHGPLHNPYAYGFFEMIQHTGQAHGPSPGGTVYLGDSFPPQYRGAYLCCDFISHTASWWKLSPRGTTFRADFGGRLLDSRDTWFCAPDLCLGPDGSVFICDFFDRRSAHPDPDADWDRSNGRIYKIEAHGTKPVKGLDLGSKSSKELVRYLRHANGWYAEQARVLLASRRDKSVWEELRELAAQSRDHRLALQGLWALHVSGGLEDAFSEKLLKHPGEYVRAWTVRLLGDEEKASPALARRLAELAGSEPSAIVRSQLASSARRLPGKDGLPIVEALLKRDLDAGDPHVPLLLWWAIADHALQKRERVLAFFTAPEARKSSLTRANLPRLVRRYAAEGSKAAYEASAVLLSDTPSMELLVALDRGLSERGAVLGGMGMGSLFGGFAEDVRSMPPPRKYEPIAGTLESLIRLQWEKQRDDPLLLRLAIRTGIKKAPDHLQKLLAGGKEPLPLLDILQELGEQDCVGAVLPLVRPDQLPAVQIAALGVLGRFGTPEVMAGLLQHYASMPVTVRAKARDVLFSKKESARAFLDAVEAKKISAAEVPLDQVRRLGLFEDARIGAAVVKHWGNIKPGTPEEKLADMRRFRNDLNAGKGDRFRGKELFTKHCAACHKIFNEGGTTGPDLTGFARGDTDGLLASLVDPSAVVRKEFLSYVVRTKRGATHTGLVAEADGGAFTIIDAQNNKTRIQRADVEEMRPSLTSIMPDRLLDALKPQERRDLFGYLQGGKS